MCPSTRNIRFRKKGSREVALFLGASNFSSSKKHDYKSNDGEDDDDDGDGEWFLCFFFRSGDDY